MAVEHDDRLELFAASGSDTFEDYKAHLRKRLSSGSPLPNVVLVHDGGPGLVFPHVCPMCAGAARRRVRVRKTFAFRQQGHPTRVQPIAYQIYVWFCDACTRRLVAEQKSPTTRSLRDRLDGWDRRLVVTSRNGLLACAFGLLLATVWYDNSPRLFLASCLAIAIGLILLWQAWRTSAYMAILPVSLAASAVDFSAHLAVTGEPYWGAYWFGNPNYAAMFRESNREQIWDPLNPSATLRSE